MKFYLILNFTLFFFKFINCFVIYGDFCDNCDLVGNNIQDFGGSSLEACWTSCLNKPNCNHFAFDKSNNYCWLKNKPNISFSELNFHNGIMVGIMNRSKNCTNDDDYRSNPLNCTLYHRCLSGYLQTFGCLNSEFFDHVTKTCNQNSTCCTTSKDIVGVQSNKTVSSEYFSCATKTIQECKFGFIFDLKKKKCISGSLMSNTFLMKKISGNFSLIESAILKNYLICCLWCLLDLECEIVIFNTFECQKISITENNFLVNDSLIYIKQ
ncbi:unnamed protein product [Brachionus calyciflorus]|uniref:Uncharacterized protein n=1 Tax=Brachionus calyciflorus TaxID=104777 RepID=A0A814KAM0_9BILA|nr:unnamed protein product [Brachionus calyciflorus]